MRAGAAALMAEAAETLSADLQVQAADYAAALLERFDNPNLHHRLRQIAMDGSQKMPIRVYATLVERDAPSPALEAAISAWVGFVRAEVSAGQALDDPQSAALIEACAADNPDAALRAIITPE